MYFFLIHQQLKKKKNEERRMQVNKMNEQNNLHDASFYCRPDWALYCSEV